MSSYLDALLSGAAAATKLATATSGVFVDVGNAPPPLAKQVLTATSPTTATWQVPAATGDLETNVPGAPVDISGAAPPVAGQVLTATSPTTAIWRVPGLHYDPAIRTWMSSIGSATIEPGTWGFIEAGPPGGVDPLVIFVVSSLTSPPVDSRFGLYVGRAVTVPVQVNLIGASQIMGLDGVLASSITLLPGADYEWIFYHEAGAALWGLVSDTAGVAKRIAVATGYVEVAASPAPGVGDALIATDAAHAVWSSFSGSTAEALAEAFATAIFVDVVLVSDSDLYGNSGGTDTDGIGYGANLIVLATAQSDPTENGFWQTYDGVWPRAPGLPLPGDTDVAQLVIVRDGTAGAGSTWVYLGADVWSQIGAASPITGGDGLTRVGNAINLDWPITDAVHGNRGGGALHADATTTVSGFFSGAEKVKLAGIQTGAAAVSSTAPTQITVTTAAAGAATDAARRDHVHSVATAAPVILTKSGSNVTGVSTSLARADHAHDLSTAVPVALTLAGANTEGTGTAIARADHIHALPAAGTPVALTLAGTNAAGSAASLTRSDHVHALPAVGTPSSLTMGGANAAGSAVTIVRSDHVHALPAAGTPTALTLAGANTVGVAATLALSDHVHALPASSTLPTILAVGGAGTAGASTSISKADHVHPLPGFGINPGTFCEGSDVRLDAGVVPFVVETNPGSLLYADEFFPGSNPDLAARGYTCVNASTGATMTRLGAVNWSTITLTATQYNSSIVGSYLYIQTGATMQVTKAMSAPFGCIAMRGSPSNPVASTTQRCGLIVADSTVNSTAKKITVGFVSGTGGTLVLGAAYQVGTGAINNVSAAAPLQGQYDVDVFVASKGTPTADWGMTTRRATTPTLTQEYWYNQPGLADTATVFGFIVDSGNTGAGQRHCAIDYLRRYPANTFFGY